MTIAQSVSEVIRNHVTLSVESIDRMYLNIYVPQLQSEGGAAHFFRHHRGDPFPSSALMAPMTHAFVKSIEAFVEREKIPMISFEKGQRKEDVMKEHLASFSGTEGVLFVGKAQEKSRVYRTLTQKNPATGQRRPSLASSTVMVNQYYFYGVDDDFGPFFLKFCSYFPYTARMCINGHEYVKRQLAKEGIAYEPLDNGILTCADPQRLQELCDELTAEKIAALLRKWLTRLPHPFTPDDQAAGYQYEVSMLQTEFSLTQVLDRPASGRIFFEEVIRENLDLGRPSHVQMIFGRRVTSRTPGRMRTRVITEGVIPSLHVDYKRSRIKQYFKEGRALRTETTVNNTYDFSIGKRLKNLTALREVGLQANRRLLDAQMTSHDCRIGEAMFEQMNRPCSVGNERASGIRFADIKTQMLLCALVLFAHLAGGFCNRELRKAWAPLLGCAPEELTSGQMSYHLRRLKLHGLIERIPDSHRYRVTKTGFKTAFFFTRTYARVLRPELSKAFATADHCPQNFRKACETLEKIIEEDCRHEKLAA